MQDYREIKWAKRQEWQHTIACWFPSSWVVRTSSLIQLANEPVAPLQCKHSFSPLFCHLSLYSRFVTNTKPSGSLFSIVSYAHEFSAVKSEDGEGKLSYHWSCFPCMGFGLCSSLSTTSTRYETTAYLWKAEQGKQRVKHAQSFEGFLTHRRIFLK